MICLDTSPVIWGVQGVGSSGQEEMPQRMAAFLRKLAEEGTDVMIPAPVVQEYLVIFGDDQREEQQDLIQRSFVVLSLDWRAAAKAAELEHDRALVNQIRSELGASRQQVKVDAQILGIAIVNGADYVVSHDEPMTKLANGHIKVIEVPEVGEQLDLGLDR